MDKLPYNIRNSPNNNTNNYKRMQTYKNQFSPMQNQLLSVFNNYSFHNTTQILLANLNNDELREILVAVQGDQAYEHLTHMIRVTLFINISHRVDRTFYLMHYANFQIEEFRNERISLVAGNVEPESIQNMLQIYDSLHQRVEEEFEQESQTVMAAVFDPELALPPSRRSTVAPNCLTVYQIVLACQRIDQRDQQDHSDDEESCLKERRIELFNQLLALQVEIADQELSAIEEPFEHFAQLTFKFMVYRNSVLALHEITPFPHLAKTMKLWESAMKKHYTRANNTFAEISGFKQNANSSFYGRFTPDLLIEEGYLNEYVEALVDLSIDENSVAFCAHSKQNFKELYQSFQAYILSSLKEENHENLNEQLNKWSNFGLKPCTIRKIIDQSSSLCESQEAKYEYCLRKDTYIQSCAKIHGFTDYPTNIIVCS